MVNREGQSPGTRIPAAGGLVHVLPHDDEAAGQLIGPLLRRVDEAAPAPEVVVLVPDTDTAIELVRSVEARLVPITGEARGARLLGAGAVPGIAATPTMVVGLIRRSALKLDRVHTVIVVWADEIIAADEGRPLETVMAEIPREAGRILLTSRLEPPVEELIEHYLRRAPRLGVGPEAPELPPISASYVLATPTTRRDALRRLLDELDPPSAVVFARTARGLGEARDALREMGYRAPAPVAVIDASDVADPHAPLLVLYELPATGEQLRAVAGPMPRRIVALVRPRDVDRLRDLTRGTVTPLVTGGALERARRRDAALREELHAELRRASTGREALALEPLLADFDGIEVAAAALRLLERERERRAPPIVKEVAIAAPAAFTRLFITAGTRDNLRPGDLVGMITAEGGITSEKIGRIELRESHSLVEIAADVAELVVGRINGAQVKGRRIVARPERDREDRARGASRKPGRRDHGASSPPRA